MRLLVRIRKPSGEAAIMSGGVAEAAHAVEQNAFGASPRWPRAFGVRGIGSASSQGPTAGECHREKGSLTSGSITAAVDRLESKKLVRRTADTGDLRARIVQPTETGRRLIERAFQQHAMDMEETMAVLRSSERTELVRLLKKAGCGQLSGWKQ